MKNTLEIWEKISNINIVNSWEIKKTCFSEIKEFFKWKINNNKLKKIIFFILLSK